MNCGKCNGHILATTQVNYQGNNYHADCVVDVVNQNRARVEIPSTESNLSEDYFEKLEQYDEDFYEGEDVEFQDDIDEFEEDFADAIERLDVVTPEVMPSDFQPKHEVHINEIVATVGTQMAAQRHNGNGIATIEPKVGTLISGRETNLITREDLAFLPVPPETDTFKPIAHSYLVDAIHECLSFRRLYVVREEYAVSPDGMKLFGLIELNVEYSGVRFAIGLRTSNDKSMRIGLVAGYRVTVCENKMLTGDFNPLLAKHSKNFNLLDGLSVGIDRIQRHIGKVESDIVLKKQRQLSNRTAEDFIYSAFLKSKMPMSLMRSVHNQFFNKPAYEEFGDGSLWSLENAFTHAFKSLKPVKQFEASAKLGKLIAPYVTL